MGTSGHTLEKKRTASSNRKTGTNFHFHGKRDYFFIFKGYILCYSYTDV